MGRNFEFQVQDSFLEIGRFEKRIALSEKNPTLITNVLLKLLKYSLSRKITYVLLLRFNDILSYYDGYNQG